MFQRARWLKRAFRQSLVAIVTLVVGCGRASQDDGEGENPGGRPSANAPARSIGGTESTLDSLSLRDALDRLTLLEGEFKQSATGLAFEFSGDRSLFRRIRAFQGEAVPLLVSCMSDTSNARATVDGRPVPLGVMCYYALDSFVYYETTDSSGDSGGSWAGRIDARATFAELRLAREAWSKLLEPPGYIMIPPAQ